MCSSVSCSMNCRPVPGSTMHIASSALSRVSRGVSETATGRGAGSPAPFCSAPASGADRTRASTRLGSVSSRSATFRTSSSKPSAVSPIAFSTGPTSSSTRSRPARLPSSPRPSATSTRKLGRSIAPSTSSMNRSERPLLQHVGRVLPLRHRRDPQLQAPATGHLLRPDHRVRPGPVRIERQHHRIGQPGQHRDLLRRDRRPHDRHRLLHPGLVQRQHVRVPLDHDRPPRLRDRPPRPIDPVERVALPIELALGRVQVLRLRVRAQRPRPEPEHPPALVADRERDPVPEAVVVPALPPLLREPGREQLLDLEPRPLAPGQHLVPRARRHPDAEAPQHLLPQPPLGQVGRAPSPPSATPTGTARRTSRSARAAPRASPSAAAAPRPADPRSPARARRRSARPATRPRPRSPAPPSPRRSGTRPRSPRSRSSNRACPAG